MPEFIDSVPGVGVREGGKKSGRQEGREEGQMDERGLIQSQLPR